MSNRSTLNLVSRKKRDTMLAYSNVTAANPTGSATFTTGGATLTGNNAYAFLWCPTARDLNNSTGGANIVINDAERTSTTCYMRGVKENIRIQTTDGMPWEWRRICFTLKGTALNSQVSSTINVAAETAPGGWRRSVTNWSSNSVIYALVFKGLLNSDWQDPLTAPVDNTRITVKYDRHYRLAAGNEEGMNRVYKMWHGMNRNLVYDDDESGDGKASSSFSTTGKAGMGDYYILDLITPRTGATSSSQMLFTPESTLYWHEK